MLSSLFSPTLPAAFEYPLDDGLRVLLRPIRHEDAPRLRDGFRQLSQLARRRRFLDHVDDLSEEQLKAFTSTDDVSHVAWGALNLEKPDEPGIGIARYVRLEDDPKMADVAIVIADEYQGRGTGFVLQACLHLSAHRAGIRSFNYDVLSDNERIIKHLKLMGAEHAGRADNIDRLRMPVYSRAWDVPDGNEIGKRFAEVFRKLRSVQAAAD
ncbi:N-acetyltransferase [Solimonas sp. K1W22B-7]|uniref:GNAT family N-acetyltransferase n=1 Tax=Solimonas sp. K1W22B-7 TaxID=2303331 RepID=UPI000E330EF8|nr:GNAT family N-acetyltransferase [Solimonas sp. K1W22B-7]AXQ31830.1 N-acetyltransferase [Solimonas sp. K1W22B-7]